jgi:hypothetical protein
VKFELLLFLQLAILQEGCWACWENSLHTFHRLFLSA